MDKTMRLTEELGEIAPSMPPEAGGYLALCTSVLWGADAEARLPGAYSEYAINPASKGVLPIKTLYTRWQTAQRRLNALRERQEFMSSSSYKRLHTILSRELERTQAELDGHPCIGWLYTGREMARALQPSPH